MRVIKLNDRGIEVQKIQLLLNSLLKPSPYLKIDGHFGQRTQQAVLAFQRSKGVPPDGEIGPMTREALFLRPVATPMPRLTSMENPWMNIAIAELGVHEDSRPSRHNARILEYHSTTTLKSTTDETPWCSSFVNWVMCQSKHRGTNNAAAKSWLDWGMKLTKPTVGSIIVIKKKSAGFTNATGSSSGFHVGFFVSLSGSHVRILGGNQSDQVKYSDFSLSSYEIRGYRRPN